MYSYQSFLRMITTIPSDKMSSLGRSMYFWNDFKGPGIKQTFTDESFSEAGRAEKDLIQRVKENGLALGVETPHSLMYDGFAKDRTICVFNLIPEETVNSLKVERSGNLRIQTEFAKGENKNRMIVFFADTTGVLEVDKNYTVRCVVRA